MLNDHLLAGAVGERVTSNDVVMSVRVRAPNEIRASSYIITALIVCFDGFGFEPQGNTGGRADFAKRLVLGADALKGL